MGGIEVGAIKHILSTKGGDRKSINNNFLYGGKPHTEPLKEELMKIRYLLLLAVAIPLIAGQATFEETAPVLNHSALHAPRLPSGLRQGDTLKYDLNTWTGGLGLSGSGTPAPDQTFGFATYFVLSEFGITDPKKVGSILIHFSSLTGTYFRLYVWDDAGGVPNSHATHLYSNMNAPLGTGGVWTEYNIAADNVELPDTFWVGICYDTLTNPPNWYISYDGTLPDIHTYGNLNGGVGDWLPMSAYGYGFAFGVRVVVEDTTVVVDDVGTTAILSPPSTVIANSAHDPQATYENFGSDSETFDVYFLIDSSGTNIYNQTANITLNGATDTTITWPTWYAGPNDGITYDVTAYTVLAGDVNPANDTMMSTTTTASQYWEILDPPVFPTASSGHSQATAHDGYYYVFSTGGNNDEVQIYDIENNTWSAGTTNPYGTGAYGTAHYVQGSFYRIGGWDGDSACDRVDIYDPVGTSWTGGASAPARLIDHAAGVFNDSLIFCMGGGNWFSTVFPTNTVYFYDVYNDSWTTATSFPGIGRGCLAGGVIDTFAIVACGYDGSAMRIDYIVGTIDPANPATINWGSAQVIPGTDSLYRIPSGVDNWNQEFWMTCGQKWTVQINETWSYSPYTDVWTNWNKPKPQVIANVTPIVITKTAGNGDLGLFVAGGYYGGGPVSDHEVLHTGKDTTGIAEETDAEPAAHFGFALQMPNPTRGYQSIAYTTTINGKVSVKVYDQTGRLVRTLVNRALEPAGTKTVYWNGKDDARHDVSNGIYFIKLEAEGKTATHKLILVR